MSDAERLGAAVTLALFFHFLIILWHPEKTELPVNMSLEVLSSEQSALNPERSGAGTGISTTPSPETPENEQRNKRRQALLQYLDDLDTAIHARRLSSGREDLIGAVLCALTIMPDGNFANARIIRSSGNIMLDQDALKAVSGASGAIKRPPIIGNEPLEISLWIKYQYDLH